MKNSKNEYKWIFPEGGYGDMLMLSGILKLINEKDPNKKFNLVRRTAFTNFFINHPAIFCIGNPGENAEI